LSVVGATVENSLGISYQPHNFEHNGFWTVFKSSLKDVEGLLLEVHRVADAELDVSDDGLVEVWHDSVDVWSERQAISDGFLDEWNGGHSILVQFHPVTRVDVINDDVDGFNDISDISNALTCVTMGVLEHNEFWVAEVVVVVLAVVLGPDTALSEGFSGGSDEWEDEWNDFSPVAAFVGIEDGH